MSIYWNQPAETMPQEELETLQCQRLREIISWSYERNLYYRGKMDEAGVKPEDIRKLSDIRLLPMMNKESFRETYPLGMLCVDQSELREMHMSSGSTGTPVVMGYTEEDLVQWGECMARCYRMAGLDVNETIQITPSFGLFNGGFGFYHGARKAGQFIIPAGSGNTSRQIRLMQDFSVKGLMGVVSYAVRIKEVLDELGEELPDLKIGIFGAETFSDNMRTKIQDSLGIEAFDIYGMTETGGVGTTGMDCPAHDGIHVWQDQYITEIINPETGEAVPDGEQGEVVFTALCRKGIPVIRFRTGDLTSIRSRETCACGRTSLRINRITGRVDDMLIVKGVNFFPKQVEQALMEIPGVLNEYQIIIEESHGMRDVRINVEAEEGVTGFMVEKHLKERLQFSPKGDIFKAGELPRLPGKAKRVFYKKLD